MYEHIRNAAFAFALMVLLPLTTFYGLYVLKLDPYPFFYASLALGLLFIIIGTFLKIEYLGAGFILGGIANIALGTTRIWYALADLTRFLGLLAALIAVIALVLVRFTTKKW